jgi:hypothetical protein
MRVASNILKCFALLAVTILCGSLSYRVITAPKLPDLAATITKLNLEIDEAHRLTLEAGLTAMEARKASVKESAMLDQWNTSIATTMLGVQNTMAETAKTVASIRDVTGAATSTLVTAQQTVQALQAPIQQATATLQAAQRATESLQLAVVHLDVLVTDPAIPKTIANVQSTTGHLDATANNLEQTFYKYTHPGIWAKIKGAALDIAHVFNPL